MTNYERQLKKFVLQHPEYAGELESGNLGMNVFCDILRREPKAIIAESNLPHDLDRIGMRLATSWRVTERGKEEPQRKPARTGERTERCKMK